MVKQSSGIGFILIVTSQGVIILYYAQVQVIHVQLIGSLFQCLMDYYYMYFMNRCKNKHIEVGVLSLTKQELSSGVLFASVCLGVIVSSSRCKLLNNKVQVNVFKYQRCWQLFGIVQVQLYNLWVVMCFIGTCIIWVLVLAHSRSQDVWWLLLHVSQCLIVAPKGCRLLLGILLGPYIILFRQVVIGSCSSIIQLYLGIHGSSKVYLFITPEKNHMVIGSLTSK